MTATRRYRGQSAEERKSARREQIIAAGRELLATSGLAGTTIAAICARAGLIDRYFYESFPNRDAFLDTVFDQIATDGAAAIFGRVAAGPNDPKGRLKLALEGTLDAVDTDPAFQRVVAELQSDEAQRNEALMRHRDALIGKLADLTEQYVNVIFGPQPYEAALGRMAIVFAIGGSVEIATQWLTGKLDITREQLVEHCTDLIFSVGTTMIEKIPRLADALPAISES